MNDFTKKLIALALSLVLCALPALAEDASDLSALCEQAIALAFDTSNATVTINATFSLDGKAFKNMNLTQKQDGYNSVLNYELQTPGSNREAADNGFIVVGVGDVAYSIPLTTIPYCYTASSMTPSSTMLRKTILNRALMGLVSAASQQLFTCESKDSAAYSITYAPEKMSDTINKTLTYLLLSYAKKYYFISDVTEDAEAYYNATETQKDYAISIEYDDFNATFALFYEDAKGEPMPEDFLENAAMSYTRDPSWNTYLQINANMDEFYRSAALNKNAIFAWVHEDGTADYFESYDDYNIAAGNMNISYEDYDASFLAYYNEITGDSLSQEDYSAIWVSGNPVLWSAYSKMTEEMEEAFQAKARAQGGDKVLSAFICADGTIVTYDTWDGVYDGGITTTQLLINNMQEVALTSFTGNVNTDNQGRLSSGDGTIEMTVYTKDGVSHLLTVTFTATAGDYGTTSVPGFDPAEFDAISWDEFNEQQSASQEDIPPVTYPKTIYFNGVNYNTMIVQ